MMPEWALDPEVPMLKIAIVACALCSGAGATLILVKSESQPETPAVSQSFQDRHAQAHLDNLPVRSDRRAD